MVYCVHSLCRQIAICALLIMARTHLFSRHQEQKYYSERGVILRDIDMELYSVYHWNCFKGTSGKTQFGMDIKHLGLFECIDTILKVTDTDQFAHAYKFTGP